MKSDEAVIVLDYRINDPTRRYLIYSKTIQDRLPITTTTFDTQPCINPAQTSTESGFYPSERDRADTCIEDGMHYLDPRYIKVGESKSVSEL